MCYFNFNAMFIELIRDSFRRIRLFVPAAALALDLDSSMHAGNRLKKALFAMEHC